MTDKQSNLSRRKFIITSATGLAGATLLSSLDQDTLKKSITQDVRKGEEWRVSGSFAGDELKNLRTREEVLAEATEGIEKYRKGKAELTFVDPEGKIKQGLAVDIIQKEHAFDWGCSSAGTLKEDAESEEKRERTKNFVALFNCTTAKCYWTERWHQPIEKEEGNRITKTFTDEVQWGLSNGLRVKGHPLVWTVRKAIPEWMDKYSYPEQLKHLENHVRSMIRTGGKSVNRWDLCNEMLWEPSLRNLAKRDWPHIENVNEILSYLEPAVHWAKEENPDAIYSLNDYGLEVTYTTRVTAREQRKRYVDLVNEMKKRGCAPDAVGTQCHVAGWYAPDVFKRSLNDLSQAGLPVQITEFWANIKDCPDKSLAPDVIKSKLLEYVSDCYTIAFGHKEVNHFTFWGGAGIDRAGKKTEVYDIIYKLVKEKWQTNLSLSTNKAGIVSFRAFYGDYSIRYKDKNGNIRSVDYAVSPHRDNKVIINLL